MPISRSVKLINGLLVALLSLSVMSAHAGGHKGGHDGEYAGIHKSGLSNVEKKVSHGRSAKQRE